MASEYDDTVNHGSEERGKGLRNTPELTANHEQIRVARRWSEHKSTRHDVLCKKSSQRGVEWSVACEKGCIWENSLTPQLLDDYQYGKKFPGSVY